MNALQWLLLIILSVLWGGSFTVIEYALEYFTPLQVAALRAALAAPVLWMVLLARGLNLPQGRRIWGALLALGLINTTAPFFLFSWGQQFITGGAASVLNGATPMFGAVLAHFLVEGEQMTPLRVAGLLIGVGGLVMLVGPTFGNDMHAVAGQAAVLTAAFCYGVGSIIAKRLAGVPLVTTATMQVSVTAVTLISLTLFSGGPHNPAAPLAVWGALAVLAVFSTALAYLIYFYLVRHAGPTRTVTVTLLIPVSATILAAVFLGERPGPNHYAAMALVLLGVSLIICRPRAKPMSKASRGESG